MSWEREARSCRAGAFAWRAPWDRKSTGAYLAGRPLRQMSGRIVEKPQTMRWQGLDSRMTMCLTTPTLARNACGTLALGEIEPEGRYAFD